MNKRSNPDACVHGEFVYQRKRKGDDWGPANTISFARFRSGEAYKLELHAEELLILNRALNQLHNLHREQGVPPGHSTFVKLETTLGRFLSLGEADLTEFLETHRDDASTTLLKLIRWMTKSSHGSAAASRLAAMQPDDLPNLTALLGVALLKGALADWTTNMVNPSEEFWQRAFAERVYVLSQVYAYPIVFIGKKAYVGGKQIQNVGASYVDFLATVESTDAILLMEIKTPLTPLLGREYRDGVFPFSQELSGAIAQVLTYRRKLIQHFDSTTADVERRLTIGDPRCLVVAGTSGPQLSSQSMRESFELQRERLQGVSVVTYDELFRKLEQLIRLIEGREA